MTLGNIIKETFYKMHPFIELKRVFDGSDISRQAGNAKSYFLILLISSVSLLIISSVATTHYNNPLLLLMIFTPYFVINIIILLYKLFRFILCVDVGTVQKKKGIPSNDFRIIEKNDRFYVEQKYYKGKKSLHCSITESDTFNDAEYELDEYLDSLVKEEEKLPKDTVIIRSQTSLEEYKQIKQFKEQTK